MAVPHSTEYNDTRAREFPDRNRGNCGKKGHRMIGCPSNEEDTAIAMDVLDDFVHDDSVRSDADTEAFTSIDMTKNEATTGEREFMVDMGDKAFRCERTVGV